MKTDRAKELLQEINNIKLDENKMKPREVKALAQVLTELMCSQTFNKMISNLCSTLSLDLTPTKYKNKIRHRKAVVSRMMIIKYPYLFYSVVLVLPFPLQSL